MMICVCPPTFPFFARALGAMERGQLPREIDVEMLRGPIYGPKANWPAPFSSWAGRWSKKRTGDAPASSLKTNGGGATATSAAARAAIAELLRAAAVHASRHAAGSAMPQCRAGAYVRLCLVPPPRVCASRVASSCRAVVCASSRIATLLALAPRRGHAPSTKRHESGGCTSGGRRASRRRVVIAPRRRVRHHVRVVSHRHLARAPRIRRLTSLKRRLASSRQHGVTRQRAVTPVLTSARLRRALRSVSSTRVVHTSRPGQRSTSVENQQWI